MPYENFETQVTNVVSRLRPLTKTITINGWGLRTAGACPALDRHVRDLCAYGVKQVPCPFFADQAGVLSFFLNVCCWDRWPLPGGLRLFGSCSNAMVT